MNYLSIGDLAQTFQTRRQNVALKSDLQRLSQEMTSGARSDATAAAGGDFSALSSIERSLTVARSYSVAASEAALLASTAQASLETVEGLVTELAPALLTAGSSAQALLIQATAADGRAKFETALAALNVRAADRYALSGTATDTPPLADAETILADLQAAIATETTAAGIAAAVEAWFDTPGGGFETVAYRGSEPVQPLRLSDDTSVRFDVTAADERVRNTLKGLAMVALLDAGALSGAVAERAELARLAGVSLLDSESGMAALRADVGIVEASVDQTAARNAATVSALEMARNGIMAVDPYKTATELEAVRSQLEILYSVTARLSRLSLADYL